MAAIPNQGGGVQSVDRAFDILEIMAAAGGSIALSELAETAGLPLPTIHRLTRSLVSRGYVRQLPSRKYALGPKLIRLGESATQLIGAWSRPHLSDLVRATGETANMAVLDGTAAVYVAQVPSEHSMRMFTEVGKRVYTHCTGVGKALLAQLPDDSVRSIVARAGMPRQTPNTHTDPDSLITDLGVIRQRGYAIDEGEQEIGVRCFSVPVPNAPTPTAISVSGPAARVTVESADHIVPLLKRVAKELATEFDTNAAL
ncbi:IclR family transcriptional regulator [Antrihabitans sp. YC2-6]|uniref:IclR family transcriptional regulator n=1 Tax=Antrihabitans sp. YC2-6 TaxID=2799498 RepID=UPI0018F3B97A|nr:IclR family transcriptional regulator [Antrihabitans sp. YC2-6]MBJ8344656.1 IclR family transcriptional regulator [Antrihabitans sp. YC2-6]